MSFALSFMRSPKKCNVHLYQKVSFVTPRLRLAQKTPFTIFIDFFLKIRLLGFPLIIGHSFRSNKNTKNTNNIFTLFFVSYFTSS
jgi:hypothetical protein